MNMGIVLCVCICFVGPHLRFLEKNKYVIFPEEGSTKLCEGMYAIYMII